MSRKREGYPASEKALDDHVEELYRREYTPVPPATAKRLADQAIAAHGAPPDSILDARVIADGSPDAPYKDQ